MGRLENKVAVITGGNSGIGLASAKRFHAEGARVAILGRNPDTLAQAKAEIGPGTLAVQGDVTNPDDLARLLSETEAAFGKVDVLFANAGMGEPGPLAELDEASFDRQFDINVKGMVFTAKAALPHLSENASVLLTSSVVDEMPMPGMSVYAATKAATRSFVKTLALELAPSGVRVNSIAPGPIETGFFGRIDMPQEAVEEMAAGIIEAVPMKRFGSSDEVANVALFLASDEASYVTGAEFVVDGGMLLQSPGG